MSSSASAPAVEKDPHAHRGQKRKLPFPPIIADDRLVQQSLSPEELEALSKRSLLSATTDQTDVEAALVVAVGMEGITEGDNGKEAKTRKKKLLIIGMLMVIAVILATVIGLSLTTSEPSPPVATSTVDPRCKSLFEGDFDPREVTPELIASFIVQDTCLNYESDRCYMRSFGTPFTGADMTLSSGAWYFNDRMRIRYMHTNVSNSFAPYLVVRLEVQLGHDSSRASRAAVYHAKIDPEVACVIDLERYEIMQLGVSPENETSQVVSSGRQRCYNFSDTVIVDGSLHAPKFKFESVVIEHFVNFPLLVVYDSVSESLIFPTPERSGYFSADPNGDNDTSPDVQGFDFLVGFNATGPLFELRAISSANNETTSDALWLALDQDREQHEPFSFRDCNSFYFEDESNSTLLSYFPKVPSRMSLPGMYSSSVQRNTTVDSCAADCIASHEFHEIPACYKKCYTDKANSTTVFSASDTTSQESPAPSSAPTSQPPSSNSSRRMLAAATTASHVCKGLKWSTSSSLPWWKSSVHDFDFGECCEKHDACYMTCTASNLAIDAMNTCDAAFTSCMQQECSSSPSTDSIKCSEAEQVGLSILHDKYFKAFFCDAQQTSCHIGLDHPCRTGSQDCHNAKFRTSLLTPDKLWKVTSPLMFSDDGWSFNTCCQEHNAAYSVCQGPGGSRTAADNRMVECVNTVCANSLSDDEDEAVATNNNKYCAIAAESLRTYLGTFNYFFCDAQRSACTATTYPAAACEQSGNPFKITKFEGIITPEEAQFPQTFRDAGNDHPLRNKFSQPLERVLNLYQHYWAPIMERASALSIDPIQYASIINLETPSDYKKGLAFQDGQLVARFELALFRNYFRNRGQGHYTSLIQKYLQDDSAYQLYVCESGMCPTQICTTKKDAGKPCYYTKLGWSKVTASLASMYRALELAQRIHNEAALLSSSFGFPQLLGDNYGLFGSPNAAQFYLALSSNTKAQFDVYDRFLQKEKKFLRRSCLFYLQQKDYLMAAGCYNGNGKIGDYGCALMQTARNLDTLLKILSNEYDCMEAGRPGRCVMPDECGEGPANKISSSTCTGGKICCTPPIPCCLTPTKAKKTMKQGVCLPRQPGSLSEEVDDSTIWRNHDCPSNMYCSAVEPAVPIKTLSCYPQVPSNDLLVVGRCYNTKTESCDPLVGVGNLDGLCPGDASIKCCATVPQQNCVVYGMSGTCVQRDRCSPGNRIAYEAATACSSSPAGFICCIPKTSCTMNNNNQGGICTSADKCTAFGGVFTGTSASCPGSADPRVRCCLNAVDFISTRAPTPSTTSAAVCPVTPQSKASMDTLWEIRSSDSILNEMNKAACNNADFIGQRLGRFAQMKTTMLPNTQKLYDTLMPPSEDVSGRRRLALVDSRRSLADEPLFNQLAQAQQSLFKAEDILAVTHNIAVLVRAITNIIGSVLQDMDLAALTLRICAVNPWSAPFCVGPSAWTTQAVNFLHRVVDTITKPLDVSMVFNSVTPVINLISGFRRDLILVSQMISQIIAPVLRYTGFTPPMDALAKQIHGIVEDIVHAFKVIVAPLLTIIDEILSILSSIARLGQGGIEFLKKAKNLVQKVRNFWDATLSWFWKPVKQFLDYEIDLDHLATEASSTLKEACQMVYVQPCRGGCRLIGEGEQIVSKAVIALENGLKSAVQFVSDGLKKVGKWLTTVFRGRRRRLGFLEDTCNKGCDVVAEGCKLVMVPVQVASLGRLKIRDILSLAEWILDLLQVDVLIDAIVARLLKAVNVDPFELLEDFVVSQLDRAIEDGIKRLRNSIKIAEPFQTILTTQSLDYTLVLKLKPFSNINEILQSYINAPDGAYCVFSEMCLSSMCKGGKCCSRSIVIPDKCWSCDTVGRCASCQPGYYLKDYVQCKQQLGEDAVCYADDECLVGKCIQGRCCSERCGFCPADHFFNGNACQLQRLPGQECSSDLECRSTNNCQQGFCCATADRNCIACHAGSGLCDKCINDHQFALVAGKCIPFRDASESCKVDNLEFPQVCRSGMCKGGRCCHGEVALLNDCVECSSSNGECSSCSSSTYLKQISGCSSDVVPFNNLVQRHVCYNSDVVCVDEISNVFSECMETRSSTIDYETIAFGYAGDVQGAVTACLDDLCTNADSKSLVQVSTACVSKIADGLVCELNGQCVSGYCGGMCCRRETGDGCVKCDEQGFCLQCTSFTHYLVPDKGLCRPKRKDGALCIGFSDESEPGMTCSSTVCRKNCCINLPTFLDHCLECGTDGKCSVCEDGYYGSNGACYKKKNDGEVCGQPFECWSGSCKGGACCRASAANDGNCVSCISTGACQICASNYFLGGNNICTARKNDGAACNFIAGECKSNLCVQKICCAGNVGKGCTKCNSNGACISCVAGEYISNQMTCKSVRRSDVECDPTNYDKSCASGRCSPENDRCCSTNACTYNGVSSVQAIEQHYVNLDRVPFKCTDRFGLQEFKLVLEGPVMHYSFRCGPTSRTSTMKTDGVTAATVADGKVFHFLDRQNVDCGPTGVLAGFHFRNNYDFTLMWYDYQCVFPSAGLRDCVDMQTPLNQGLSNRYYQFLDRHDIDCGGAYVQRFQLGVVDGRYIQYNYRCCSLK